MMQSLLQRILTTLAQAYLARYKPAIVAVTGNVGKTSTKEAIGAVLGTIMRVRMSGGNLNNELGVPLSIIGDWSEEYYQKGSSFFLWAKVITRGIIGLIFPLEYPKVLVLEYGADHPGDIARLVKLYKPTVGVVTAVGEIPVHVEYFSGPEALAKEKSELVRALDPRSLAILNFDDQVVLDMQTVTKAQVRTFGFGDGASVRISNLDLSTDDRGRPQGINFKLHLDGSLMPMKIEGSLGRSQTYASAAAAIVGLHFGMNLVEINKGLLSYRGTPGRLRIIPGIRGSVIIDDTYNAAPAAMHLALDTLRNCSAPRKVAVLGDMLELGRYSLEVHRTAGNKVGNLVHALVCVGEKAKFIADSAANQMAREQIYTFHTSEEAKSKVQELIKEGDLVLVKGSQGMRMEKIVEEIMAEPERKEELLVRQSKKWLSK